MKLISRFFRSRNVVEETAAQVPQDRELLTRRAPVNRAEARTCFGQLQDKAEQTREVLNALGQGFSLSLDNASDQLRAVVRHLDPPSEGQFISWALYQRCVERVVAASFPDLVAFERDKSQDPIQNSQTLKTLFLEQAMHLESADPFVKET